MQTQGSSNNKERINMPAQKHAAEGKENLPGAETMPEVQAKLSEIVSELPPEQQPVKAAAKKTHKLTSAQLKAKLLANLPSEKRMKAEIEREINGEVKSLEFKAKKLMYFGPINYFELTNVLAKIHELKDILASLLNATLELIKSLWFRFIHGIAL